MSTTEENKKSEGPYTGGALCSKAWFKFHKVHRDLSLTGYIHHSLHSCLVVGTTCG